MELEIIAQIIGFIPLILSYVSYCFNDRKKMLITKGTIDLLGVVHHVLLGPEGYSGAGVNLINTVRSIVYMNKDKIKHGQIFIPIVFVTITMASSFFTWVGPISLLPTLGSSLAVIGYWCTKPENIRKFNLPGVTLWLIYSIAIFSISGIIGNCLAVFSIIRTEIKCRKEQKKGV